MLMSEYDEIKKKQRKLGMECIRKQIETMDLKKEIEEAMEEFKKLQEEIDNAESIEMDTVVQNQ